MTRRVGFLLALALWTAACSGNAVSPTGPSAVTLTTEVFVGQLAPGAFRYYSFTTLNPGTVAVMLASVADGTTPTGDRLTIGVGVPSGTGCAVGDDDTATVRAALATALQYFTNPATLCVRVSDPGALARPVDFAVRLTHP
ncbi:MAG: hypothetical protein AB7O67_02510 [Vicinamibacterales bacterium]